jgi:hypothetical protein
LDHHDKWSSWNAFNWPIDEGSFSKLEHLDKSSFRSAFNWPIDVGNFCKLPHPTKSKFLECFQLANRWTYFLKTLALA